MDDWNRARFSGILAAGLGGWRAVFWAVGIFASLLLVAAGLTLPESLPVDHRHSFNLGSLLGTYRHVGLDRQFMLLSMSSALNFGALFLYISSAPIFIFDFLRLTRSDFYWLFVPAVIGILSGSGVAARISGRFSDSALLRVGFGIMLVACIGNCAMNVVLKQPVLPWAVVPICLNAFGIALSQPLLTLLGLERFPRQRGAAASMQAFLALVVNATVSGLLAPAAVSNPFTLSAVALAINAGGFILWLLTGMAKEKGAHRVAGDEGVIAD